MSSRNDFVAVTAAMSPADGCNGGVSWLFPGASPGTLKALSVTSDFSAVDSWAKAQRGIPLAGNSIRMTVLALNGRTVLITDFGVRVVRKAAPARGIIAGLTGGCGGLTPALFAADLDRPNVVAKPIAGKDAAGKAIPPAPMPHQVSESSPEVWVLRVDTAGCDCQFIPYFDWTSGTSSGRYEVTLADQAPWRVTARGSTKVVFRTDTAGHWG